MPWRPIIVVVLLMMIAVGTMVGFGFLHDEKSFRTESEVILLDLNEEGLAGQVYDDASFRFQQTMIKEKFLDLTDMWLTTLGKFKEISKVIESRTIHSSQGKAGYFVAEMVFEKGTTIGEMSFHQGVGADPKWKLLGMKLYIPELLQAKAKKLEIQYERIKAPNEVVDLLGPVLLSVRDGKEEQVHDNASPQFRDTISKERFVAMIASGRTELGDFVRVLAIISSAQNNDKTRARIYPLLEFSKVKTTGTFEFIKIEGKWQLLAFKWVIPEPLIPLRTK